MVLSTTETNEEKKMILMRIFNGEQMRIKKGSINED